MQKKLLVLLAVLMACTLFTPITEAQPRQDCGPGVCIAGSFCDDCQCYAPDTDTSRAFCQCGLLDPSCGIGECIGDSYCDGPNCPMTGVCWASSTPQSQVMCGGASLNEKCEVVRKDEGCGPGYCVGDSFCDGCACYAPDTNISKLFCQCELLDPACGLGECVGNSYCEGPNCPTPVCYIPSSPISLGMCAGVALDKRCNPIPEPGCVMPPSDMHCWWTFDETSGTTAADIIGGHDGIHYNNPSPAVGMVAGALSFDGVNDYVEATVGASHDYTNLTIDAWIKPNTVSSDMVIVDYGNSLYGLSLEGDELRFYTQVDTLSYAPISTNANIQAGVWSHVAVTADTASGSFRWYVNGNLVDVLPIYNANSSYYYSTSKWEIGSLNSGTGYQFDGLIDELEIFERALSEAEIQGLFNAGPAGKCKVGG